MTTDMTTPTTFIDVGNGDADGLCALRQLRLAEPRAAALITGLKREIDLLARVTPAAGLVIDVCDVSLDRNRAGLEALLAAGARVRYFDHHHAGEIPSAAGLEAHIDTDAAMCTSAIVDRFLEGRFRLWAITGAYGDNMPDTAGRLADAVGLDADRRQTLRALGESINYNAYGETAADILVHPRDLYALMTRHDSPETLAREPMIQVLVDQRADDLAHACAVAPHRRLPRGDIVILPDATWSRRVSGTFAHLLAERDPQRAHAVLRPNADGTYNASIRAPLAHPFGAGAFCLDFGTGGGRAGAAGIDRLPPGEVERLVEAFARETWSAGS